VGQTGGTVHAVTRAAPDVAALVLAVPAFAQVAIVVPRGGGAAGPAGRSDLASAAGSTRRTDAGVARDAVHAGGTSRARVARALVHVDATVRPGEAGRALASEPVHAVDALAAVQARQRLAVVDVASTVGPFETLAADAPVLAVRRVHASGTVLAGIARAGRRRRDVTGRALPTWRAVTREAIAAILTTAAVPAGTRLAVTGTKRTGLALPAAAADARKVRHAVHAGAVVPARLRHALVHIWNNVDLYRIA